MKRLLLTIFTLTVFLAIQTGTASATTYSDTNFSAMAYTNGAYVAGSPGYAHLSYTGNDAVVGVKGSLGTLNSLNMSFVYSKPFGTGNAPYAAFGISDDITWGGEDDRLVVSMNGSQLNGTSQVHVWDWNINSDVSGFGQFDNRTLNSILDIYGTYNVMRAYAYIGNTGGDSSGSVDINSITVTSAPVPEPGTMMLLGIGLCGLAIFGKRRMSKEA